MRPLLIAARRTRRAGGWPRRLLERLQAQAGRRAAAGDGGLKWGAAGLLHRSVALFLAGFAAVTLLDRQPAAAACGGRRARRPRRLPLVYVRRMARARGCAAFEEQFPDCLEFISRSMRAGHAFSVALEMAHREFSDPLAAEFRRAFEEQNLGQPLDIVLRKLAQRVRLDGRAVLRLGGAAAETHRREPGGTARQAGAPDPGALQAAGAHSRGQRAGADVGPDPVGDSGGRWGR